MLWLVIFGMPEIDGLYVAQESAIPIPLSREAGPMICPNGLRWRS